MSELLKAVLTDKTVRGDSAKKVAIKASTSAADPWDSRQV